ncbi:hypothetical protein C0995_015705 [Termitomyces sp. Mi166|nr:hypothetical protein C0995_015705 [Termitomyces sp. Mi166\
MYSESVEPEALPDARSPLLPRKKSSARPGSAQSELSTSQVYSDGLPQSGDQPETATGRNLHYLLYISHFLSTWNSRLFEFGAILFVTSIYTGTLLPTSAYALIRTAAAILFSPTIGKYIDSGNRLQVVRLSIELRIIVLGVVTLLACLEKLGSVMNTVAVERDWVSILSYVPADWAF